MQNMQNAQNVQNISYVIVEKGDNWDPMAHRHIFIFFAPSKILLCKIILLGVRWLDAPIPIFSRQRSNPPEIFSCSICQYFARLTSKTNSVWMALTNILRNLLFRFLLRPLSWKSMYLPPLHPPTVQLTDKMAKGHWSSFYYYSLSEFPESTARDLVAVLHFWDSA